MSDTRAANNSTDGGEGEDSDSVLELIPQEEIDKAREACHRLHQNISEPEPQFGLYCPRIFDGWSCWNDTPAGTTANVSCPSFVSGFYASRRGYRVCTDDGTWFRHPLSNKSWSNYTTCVDPHTYELHLSVNRVYLAGYSISLAALGLSLFIFFYFRQLRCKRVTIHKNLFLSFSINNFMWLVWHLFVIEDIDILHKNDVSCQALHILLHYFLVSNFMWMFCEGLYLHTLLAVAFVSEGRILKWFYALGWGVPGLLILIYSIARGCDDTYTKSCWMDDSPYNYILSVPVVMSLVLSLFFLFNIVRVLVTKLRSANTTHDDHPTRKAVRATLILIPLLGLHYLIIPFRPAKDSPGVFVYHILSALASSIQGFAVSLLFCFFNGEVLSIFKKKWKQHRLMNAPNSYAATSASYMKTSMADGVTLTTNFGSTIDGDDI